MKSHLSRIAAVGLAFGGVFGMAGTMAPTDTLRALSWAVDSVGLVVATSLLALRYFRLGKDIVAGGFLVFAIGEAVILGGTSATPAGSVPAFAGGTALWSAALMLTSAPKEFAIWTRATGLISSILFGFTSISIFSGKLILPTASPLPFFAYPFLVATFVGWIVTILKANND